MTANNVPAVVHDVRVLAITTDNPAFLRGTELVVVPVDIGLFEPFALVQLDASLLTFIEATFFSQSLRPVVVSKLTLSYLKIT